MRKFTRSLFVAAAMAVVVAVVATPALAVDGTWILNGNDVWSNSARWQDANVADGVGATANITAYLTNNGRTVTLDTPRTLGYLNTAGRIGGAGTNKNWTIAGTGANILTFYTGDANSAEWNIGTSGFPTSSSGDQITAPVLLKDLLVVSNYTQNSAYIKGAVTVDASGYVIANAGDGTGRFEMSGGITGVSGFMQNSATSELKIITGALTVDSAGTTLTNNGGAPLNVLSAVGGTGDLVLNNNSASVQGTYITGVVNNGGTITNSGTGTGSAMINTTPGANVTGITQNSATSALTLGGGNYAGDIQVLAGTVEFASGATYSGAITGAGSIAKSGNNTTTLTGDNSSLTGSLSVLQGTLALSGTGGNLAGVTAVTATGSTLRVGDTNTVNNNDVNDRLSTAAPLTLGGANGGATFQLYGAGTGDITQSMPSLTVASGLSTIQKPSGNAATLILTGNGDSVYTSAAGSLVNITSAMVSFDNSPTGSSVSGSGGNEILIGALLNANDFIAAASGTIAAPAYTTQNDASLFAAGTNVTNSGDFTNATPTGATSINSLRIGATTASALVIGSVDTDTLSPGAILVTSGVGGAVDIDGPGKLTGTGELIVFNNSAQTLNINAPITGAIDLTKAGAGLVSLTSTTSDFTGAIGVQQGTLDFNPTGPATYANDIGGTGSITKSGANTLNLTGTISVTGGLTVDTDGGTAVLAGPGSLGGSVVVNTGGTADLTGSTVGDDATVTGTLNLSGGSSIADDTTVNDGGVLSVANSTLGDTLTVKTGGSASFSGTTGQIGGDTTVQAGATLAISSAGFTMRGLTVGTAGAAPASATITMPAGDTMVTSGSMSAGSTGTGNGGSPAGHELTVSGGAGSIVDLGVYLFVGYGGGTGTLNVSGDVTLTSHGSNNHFVLGNGTGGIGYFNLSGGTVSFQYLQHWGQDGGSAIAYQTGGILGGRLERLGESGTGNSSYTMTGGTAKFITI